MRNSKPQRKAPQPKKNKKQKKKKHPALSALARGMLTAGSTAANLYAPGSGTLVERLGSTLLNKLGLSEKNALPEDFGLRDGAALHMGGPVVATADAPVAFGRQETLNSFVRVLHREPNGDVIVHAKEQWTDVSTPATPGTQKTAALVLNPNSAELPLHQNMSLAYQNFKVLAMKLHYVHFAPTNVQARVSLMYAKDQMAIFDTSGAVAILFPQASRLSDFVVGSGYEDFSLTAEPIRKLNWYDTLQSPTASVLDDSGYQGAFAWMVDQTTIESSVNIGTCYLETVIAYCGTRSPEYVLTLATPTLMRRDLSREEKKRVINALIDCGTEVEARRLFAELKLGVCTHYSDSSEYRPPVLYTAEPGLLSAGSQARPGVTSGGLRKPG